MPDKHYTYGGSNAHMWFYCDGAGQLARMVPQQEVGETAKRGTRIHELANVIHNKNIWEKDCYKGDVKTENLNLLNSKIQEADKEELLIASKYIDNCYNINSDIRIEHHRAIYPGKTREIHHYGVNGSEFGGTIDGYYIDEDTFYMWDLKTGKTKVKAKSNEQLLFYSYLILMAWDAFAKNEKLSNFKLGIHQNESFDWWELPREEMKEWLDRIEHRIEHLTNNRLTLVKGSHCFWCKAKNVCWEYNKEAQPKIFEKVDKSNTTLPMEW